MHENSFGRANLSSLPRLALGSIGDLSLAIADLDLHLVDAGHHALKRVFSGGGLHHHHVAAAAAVARSALGTDAHAVVIDDNAHPLAAAHQVGRIDPLDVDHVAGTERPRELLAHRVFG